ncbi:MAG: DUF4129 domain-containing protein [Pyrinomonadaceae bacterium]|jgi:hypothetical protein|nr:DUF4129 domain-containing protein [Pyrinomonadaceae bacterium]
MRRFIFLTIFIGIMFCGQIFAVELIVYKDNLKTSKEELYELFEDKEEFLDESEVFARIRKKLPANQSVEYKGFTIETENAWINEKITEAENDRDNFYAKITEITERISAIETRVENLEIAVETGLSKQDNKQKLEDILNRQEFNGLVKKEKKEAQESWLEKKLREFQEWLSDWLKKLFPEGSTLGGTGEGMQTLSTFIQIVVIGLALALLGYLIYRFAPFIAAKLSNRDKKSKGTRIILGEKILADQSSKDLLDEAEKLARAGDLRLAIRKGYVALLCELSDRKVIGLAQHKTNRDYLRDVRKNQNIYQNMAELTKSFETHWYGFALAEEKDWEEFRSRYKETLAK